ncbi:MAG: N-6 DNA methylase [candidate division NC10 bacterium]|nr:N-6 DNA methylase [candidate division NC10 bacterium]
MVTQNEARGNIKALIAKYEAEHEAGRLPLYNESEAKDAYKHSDYTLDEEFLREAIQLLLDRIIFIRSCEDRGLAHGETLKDKVLQYRDDIGPAFMPVLKGIFRLYERNFNSDLFLPHPSEELKIDFKALKEVILETYDPYLFSAIGLEVLGSIYEQYLGYTLRLTDKRVKYELKPEVRKAGGVYYTPEYVVDYIVRNTVGRLLKELKPKEIERLRILDPACGSGSFLIRAYHEMLDYYQQKKAEALERRRKALMAARVDQSAFPFQIENGEPRLTIFEKREVLLRHIYGVDLDPQAEEVTKLSLMLKMLEGELGLIPGRAVLPVLDQNIKCGNSLISGDQLTLQGYFGPEFWRLRPFDWATRFPKIVEEGGFDAVIGNPPWIESKRMDAKEKRFYEEHFQSVDKQYDVFNAFIERGLQVLKNSRLLGFIVPSRFVMNPDYEIFREFLLNNTSILDICDVGEDIFEGVEMPALIITLRKEHMRSKRLQNLINVKVEVQNFREGRWREYHIPQKRFLNENRRLFTIYQSPEIDDIIRKIEEDSVTFGSLATNARGVEIGKKSSLISDEKRGKGWVPFLVGEDIDRYLIKGQHFLQLGAPGVDYKKPDLYQGEKILIRKTGTGIRATYDDEGFYAIQVIYIFKPVKPTTNLKFLLGLLNSRLMAFYYFTKFGEKHKKAFPHLRQESVLQLPIRLPDISNQKEKVLHDKVAALVDIMLNLQSRYQLTKGSEQGLLKDQLDKTDREIDDLVYKLYGITEDEIKVVKAD